MPKRGVVAHGTTGFNRLGMPPRAEPRSGLPKVTPMLMTGLALSGGSAGLMKRTQPQGGQAPKVLQPTRLNFP